MLLSNAILLIIICIVTVKLKFIKRIQVLVKNIIYAVAVLICFYIAGRKHQYLYLSSIKFSRNGDCRIFFARYHYLS